MPATVPMIVTKHTCTLANGDEYSETARVPATLWRKVGGGTETQAGIDKGERGVAKWLRQRNPKFGPDLEVTFIRVEDTPANQIGVRPEV